MSREMSAQEKIDAVKRYLNDLTGQRMIVHAFGISKASVQQWITNYESMGEDAFQINGYNSYFAD